MSRKNFSSSKTSLCERITSFPSSLYFLECATNQLASFLWKFFVLMLANQLLSQEIITEEFFMQLKFLVWSCVLNWLSLYLIRFIFSFVRRTFASFSLVNLKQFWTRKLSRKSLWRTLDKDNVLVCQTPWKPCQRSLLIVYARININCRGQFVTENLFTKYDIACVQPA